MKYLWAPWRLEYIKICDDKTCFFCKYVKEKKDKKNLVLVRGETCFCLLNRFPYNTGHLMVAPFSHKGNLEELTKNEFMELFEMMQDMKKLLTKVLKPQGFNIGINLGRVAGAGVVDHIHIHIVPRWNGDTNFMPIIASTKVMPQALKNLYNQLLREL